MNLNLKSRPGCAVDDALSLTIRSPRIEPLSFTLGSELLEYQFSIFHSDRRYGLGVTATGRIDASDGEGGRLFDLDLGQQAALDKALLLKQKLEEESSDLSFLRQIAAGMLMVLAQDHVASDRVHYVVTADLPALSRRGIVIPHDARLDDAGRIILAEYRTAMQTRQTEENAESIALLDAADASTKVGGGSMS